MFPLKTTERIRTWPYATTVLLALNVFVFLQQIMSPDAGAFIDQWGLVPANYPALDSLNDWTSLDPMLLLPFITSMFLHAGWLHLGGNMLSLWVFGPNIEDRFGHLAFVVVYLACGLAAAITQIVFSAGSDIPIVGASGAIAGVMGAFFVLFPKARVVSVIPIIIIPLIVRVPAFFYLLFFIGMNVINALTELKTDALAGKSAGVAWWAHIGGFAIGIVYALLLGQTEPDDED